MVGSRFASKSCVGPYGWALGALVLSACQFDEPEQIQGFISGGSAGTAANAGTAGTTPASGTGGSLSLGSGGTGTGGSLGLELPQPDTSGLDSLPVGGDVPATGCAGGAPPLFCDEVVWSSRPARRILYSWTTAEQAAELRRDRVLLTRTERPGLGPGRAFAAMSELAARGTTPKNQLLAKLSSELFTKVRYAWPNTWAARMGWPGEDYGDQLVRIVLKPEAWIAIVRDGDGAGIEVIDMNNGPVTAEAALATPERIAAVYFIRTEVNGNGSFYQCSGGYREFIVGNEAMIEEWSLGTATIRAQIESDAARFDTFLEKVRAEPAALDAGSFAAQVACAWDLPAAGEVFVYLRALALASEFYLPQPREIADIAVALRHSLFEPDPVVVRPGE